MKPHRKAMKQLLQKSGSWLPLERERLTSRGHGKALSGAANMLLICMVVTKHIRLTKIY